MLYLERRDKCLSGGENKRVSIRSICINLSILREENDPKKSLQKHGNAHSNALPITKIGNFAACAVNEATHSNTLQHTASPCSTLQHPEEVIIWASTPHSQHT